VDFLHSQHDNCSTNKSSERDIQKICPTQSIPLLDQFSVWFHPYIVDVKVDDHYEYHIVAAQLGMRDES